jgi:hypothetical protein
VEPERRGITAAIFVGAAVPGAPQCSPVKVKVEKVQAGEVPGQSGSKHAPAGQHSPTHGALADPEGPADWYITGPPRRQAKTLNGDPRSRVRIVNRA